MVSWTQSPSLHWGARPRKQEKQELLFYGKAGAALSPVDESSVQATLRALPLGFRGYADPI